MIFTKFFAKAREFKDNMRVLRAFPFSVKLQCDNLVSHSGVGEYKKRTCVIPFKKCIKASTIKSDRTVLYQERIKKTLVAKKFLLILIPVYL
jgi:hypothetical protein